MAEENLTAKIQTVSGLMMDLEEEIRQIKSGEIKEGTARLVGNFRRMQLRTVEVVLAAARIDVSLRAGISSRIGLLPEAKNGASKETKEVKAEPDAAV